MPLYIGDYRSDTAHLSATEHGAYLLLIMHYWQAGSLPVDEQQLMRISCTTPKEWTRIRATIAAFFEDGWKHLRIEFELTQAARLSAAGKAGGEASAKARRTKEPTVIERLRNDLGNDPPTNGQALPSHSPSPSKKDIFLSGEPKGWTPPKHGAIGKGRVYIEAATDDWKAYAEDYRAIHQREPVPNSHGGKWFKTLGEAAE